MTNEQIVSTYQRYREVGMSLNGALYKVLSREELMECAFLLDFLEGDSVTVDNDADMDRLAEMSIHDFYGKDGKNSVQRYANSSAYEAANDIEKNIINAKLAAKTSLYLVTHTDKERHIVGLADVFDSYKKVEILDLGMSQSIKPISTYIFTRLMTFDDFTSTAGVSYLFDKSKYTKLRKDYQRIYKSLPELPSSTKKAISFFRLNQKYGKPIKYL